MKTIESLKKLFQSNTLPPSHCFHPRPDKGGFGTFILFYSYFCPPRPFTFFIMEMKRTRPSLFLTARVWPEYYSRLEICQKNLHDRRFQGKEFTQKKRNFRHLLNRDKKCVNALNWDKTSKKSLFYQFIWAQHQ